MTPEALQSILVAYPDHEIRIYGDAKQLLVTVEVVREYDSQLAYGMAAQQGRPERLRSVVAVSRAPTVAAALEQIRTLLVERAEKAFNDARRHLTDLGGA